MDEKLARYEFKKQIEELRSVKGRATELISLYIPPTRQVSDAAAYLRNEYSQSSNIKSKGTRKNVMAAIESIMSRLKFMKSIPENGIVFFVGHKSAAGDQTEMVQFAVEPPEPFTPFLYRCDSQFFLEPLEGMLDVKESYGLIVVDRSEATIGVLKGSRIQIIKNMQSRVPSKHGRGGQSQRRFERLIEIAAHDYFKKVGEVANEAFLDLPEIKGLVIGGPGATKVFFAEKEYLHHELKKIIIDTFDTGYTDESGLRELVQNASDALSDLQIVREKKLMDRMMREIIKTNGLATYGYRNVKTALSMGAVDIVMLSEALPSTMTAVNCGSCGFMNASTTPPTKCPSCSGDLITTEIDPIDEIVKMAEQSGANFELLSTDSEEGTALLRTFGGIAALLRFAVDVT